MQVKIIFGLALAAAIAAISALLLMPVPKAPEVRFAELSGNQFSTSELRGKVVLVNFWATYCGPCLREMPNVIETHRRFAPYGLETVAVAVRKDQPGHVAAYAEKRALPFRVALDRSGEVATGFGNVRITPTIFLIGKDGRMLRRYVGEPNWAEIHRLVERALAS